MAINNTNLKQTEKVDDEMQPDGEAALLGGEKAQVLDPESLDDLLEVFDLLDHQTTRWPGSLYKKAMGVGTWLLRFPLSQASCDLTVLASRERAGR